MHLFTAHRDEIRRYFAHFDLPEHPLCWLRGHRARVEVIEAKYIDPWFLVTCRTCGARYAEQHVPIGKLDKDEAKRRYAVLLDAARHNAEGFERVRDGREGYAHHTLELSAEVGNHFNYRRPGVRVRVGDRWSETPFDWSIHTRKWVVYGSVGGVGNRLAQRITGGDKREFRLGAGWKPDPA